MAHESLTRQNKEEGGSNRSFGWVFAMVFLAVACWPLLHGGPLRRWAMLAAIAMAGCAWLKPAWLAVPNRVWTKLGILLGRIVSPIALGILFYAVLSPIGLLIRLFGKDPLRLKLDPGARTYWIERKPPGPPPDSMHNQF
jgi:Saxitoxin biosynthesis operon protein SxtJ